MKMKAVFVVALIFLCGSLQAQYPFQVGAHFSIAAPQNDFADQLDVLGYGGDVSFLYQIPQSVVSFGAAFNFYIYGSETRSEPWSLTIPDVTVDVTTTNSIIQGYLMMRLQPPKMPITPYLDGFFGFNYLSTSTSVESEGWDDDDEIASSTNYEDGTMSYGTGAGILIQVYQSEASVDPEDEDFAVAIDLGVRYLKGGEASYLKKGDIDRTELGKIQYNPSHSTTDLTTYHIGVSFSF